MRFTIRDVLLLTVIVAVLTGWALDHWRFAQGTAELERQNRLMRYEAEISRAQEQLAWAAARANLEQAQANLQRAELLEQAEDLYQKLRSQPLTQKEAR